jgi:hypothetical protein
MHTVMEPCQREEVASVVREKRRQRTSCNEERPMQQETTMSQWMSGGVRRLQAAVRARAVWECWWWRCCCP